jgi:hypothetical protein
VRGEGRGEGQLAEGEGQPDATERRGPNRAKNVARLPKPERKPAPPSKASKVANGDEDWQEF